MVDTALILSAGFPSHRSEGKPDGELNAMPDFGTPNKP